MTEDVSRDFEVLENVEVVRPDYSTALPQTRASAINAHGSSNHGFAGRNKHYTRPSPTLSRYTQPFRGYAFHVAVVHA